MGDWLRGCGRLSVTIAVAPVWLAPVRCSAKVVCAACFEELLVSLTRLGCTLGGGETWGICFFSLPFVLVFPAASKLMDLPQKLLPLQHSPSPHLALTIGPHVLPIPTVFGACEERGGAVRLVEQSPNPAWQVSAPQ